MMNRKCVFVSGLLWLASAAAMGQNVWIEADSTKAIDNRIRRDFSLTMEQGLKQIQQSMPDVTMDSLRRLVDDKCIETMWIDGVERMYRKSPRNLPRILAVRNGEWKGRGAGASQQREAMADTIIKCSKGELNIGNLHTIKYRMGIEVPYIAELKGETLRAWLPVPLNTSRQRLINVRPVTPTELTTSSADAIHNLVYMERPVVEGDTTHFEIEVEYEAQGVYFDPDSIIARILPYVKNEEYERYTRFEGRHIVDMSDLARKIVGDEKNPFRQSEMVYDYIVSNYPWAGAREYSTIPCIPQYVVERGYGDCGQVALLYISMMRSLGVPARWESGWMMTPGNEGIHDWAEVFFEGVGWVPVDVSFGRYVNAADPAVRNFYSTGIDAYRLAANKGVGATFSTPKRYVRSETVDSQVGEVECSKGNLFYPLWDYWLQVIEIQ